MKCVSGTYPKRNMLCGELVETVRNRHKTSRWGLSGQKFLITVMQYDSAHIMMASFCCRLTPAYQRHNNDVESGGFLENEK